MSTRQDEEKKILSENINHYLEINHLSETEAARLSGIKLSTLNSWITMENFPRISNLKKLAEIFETSTAELLSERGRDDAQHQNMMRIGERAFIQKYRQNPDFREFVDLGMTASTDGSQLLHEYVIALREFS